MFVTISMMVTSTMHTGSVWWAVRNGSSRSVWRSSRSISRATRATVRGGSSSVQLPTPSNVTKVREFCLLKGGGRGVEVVSDPKNKPYRLFALKNRNIFRLGLSPTPVSGFATMPHHHHQQSSGAGPALALFPGLVALIIIIIIFVVIVIIIINLIVINVIMLMMIRREDHLKHTTWWDRTICAAP